MKTNDERDEERGDTAAVAWTRPSFLFGAGFLAAVVVALVFILILQYWPTTAHDGANPLSPQSDPASAPASSEDGVQVGVACESGVIDTSTSMDVAPQVDDVRVAGVRVASIEGVGPATTMNGLPTCYERTTMGALLAGANFILVQGAYADKASVMETLMAPSEYRDQEIRRARSGAAAYASSGQIVVQGFKTIPVSDTHVRVLYAYSAPSVSGRILQITLDMRWVDGDWKVDSPTAPSVVEITTPGSAGLIDWLVPRG